MFRSQLVSLNGGSDLNCVDTFETGTGLVDDYIDQRFDGRHGELDIADTNEHRDLLRPCLSEEAFAESFGVDLRADLEHAIEASLEGAIRDDEELCVAPLVLDHYGSAEATNDAGIRVEDIDFDIDSLELDDSTESDFLDRVAACSSFDQRVAEYERIAEPTYQACLIESYEGDAVWQRKIVESTFGRRAAERTVERRRGAALSDLSLIHI